MTGPAWRDISLETLRAWAQEESDSTSLRSLAARLRIGRATLRSFLRGVRVSHPRVRRSVALAYLESQTVPGTAEPAAAAADGPAAPERPAVGCAEAAVSEAGIRLPVPHFSVEGLGREPALEGSSSPEGNSDGR